jgi:hypothetical protein
MYIYELHSCFTPSLLQRTYVESKAIYRNITLLQRIYSVCVSIYMYMNIYIIPVLLLICL